MRRSLFAFGRSPAGGRFGRQQERRPVSYLAEFQLKPNSEADWIKLVKRDDEPMLDKLMADRTVLAWGVDNAGAIHPGRCPIKGQEGTTHLISVGGWLTVVGNRSGR